MDGKGAADPGGAARQNEASPLIQGMIEAGFSRAQAIDALHAVQATKPGDIPKAIDWSLRQGADRNLMEYRMEREVQNFDRMDFDGYALLWGDKHRTATLEECGQRCLEWKPKPPANFACNVFVFCPLPKVLLLLRAHVGAFRQIASLAAVPDGLPCFPSLRARASAMLPPRCRQEA